MSDSLNRRHSPSLDDSDVVAQIDAYQSLPFAERAAARQQMLHQFPHLANDLAACLDGLEMVDALAPDLAEDLDSSASGALGWDLPTRALGDFRIVCEIGRGGMGVVYEAEQLSLGRRVALKVLPFVAVMDSRRLQRFKQEAQAAAVLRHSNIVAVHCVGCERGVYHYAMDLVEGESLASVIEQLRRSRHDAESDAAGVEPTGAAPADKPVREIDTCPIARLSTQRDGNRQEYFRWVARLGMQVARAVHYAHEQGIIHRDLKPSNLLLDSAGKPWVTDFGLAQVQNDQALTMSGDLLGTLRYMSPEQAEGRKLLDQRTDIYSLGATLYELLTLQPPLDGEDRQALLRQVECQEPKAPRSIEPTIPRDLETIILKSLAKQATDRYDTTDELADDLGRFLDHKPIVARRASRTSRAWRWVARHRLVSALVAVIVAVLLTSSIVGPLVAIRFARLADAEAQARRLAEFNRRELQELLSRSATQTADLMASKLGVERLYIGLLKDTVGYYKRLLERNGQDTDVQFETALALRQLARAHEKVGDPARCREYCQEAIDLLSRLNHDDSSELKYTYELAEAYWLFGDSQEDARQSLEPFRRSAVLFNDVVNRGSSTDDYVRLSNAMRIHSRTSEGLSLMFCGEFAESKSVFTSNELAGRQLVAQFPNDHEAALALAWCKSNLGVLYLWTGFFRDAERELQAAVSLIEQNISKLGPSDSVDYRIGWAIDVYRLGQVLNCLRQPGEAESHLRDAKSRLQHVLQGFPNYHLARHDHRAVRLELAMVLLQMDKWGEAESELRACIADTEDEGLFAPRHTELTALAQFQLGQILHRCGRTDEARQCFQELIALLETIEATDGSRIRLQRPRVLLSIMCPIEELRDPPRAVRDIRSSMNHENGFHWQLLGVAEFRHGHWLEARDAIQEGIKRRNGGDAFDYFHLAMIHKQLGEHAIALDWYRKGSEHFDGPLAFYTLTDPHELDEIRAEAERLLLGSESRERLEVERSEPPAGFDETDAKQK